jgi:hypothetical protein
VATFRIVWEFTESNGSGFNEVMYKDAGTPGDAINIPGICITARLALLHPLNKLMRIRASQVDSQRVTGTFGIGLIGTAPGAGGPTPVGAAAVCQLSSVLGTTRKLWLRGIPGPWYVRSGASGLDAPPAALEAALTEYFKQISFAQLGIRKLAPADVALRPNRKITKAAPNVMQGLTDLTLDLAPGWGLPNRVVIGGVSKKDLPSMNGHFQLVAVNANVITINYQTPNNTTVNGGAGKVRLESYSVTSIFNPPACSFDHYGTRTSRSPLSRSRGAKRAARLRLSL